jgi:peptidyl-dipeptidase A
VRKTGAALAMVLALTGCDANDEQVAGVAQDGAVPASAAPVAADAEAFIAAAEQQLADSSLYAAKVAWVNATYLNEDTDWLNARALAERTALAVRLASEAARFAALEGISADTRRKLGILEQMIVLPAPSTPGAAEELATLSTRLKSAYGKGRGTLGGEPKPGVELEALMGTERDPERLKEMWTLVARGGRTDAPGLRAPGRDRQRGCP